MGIFYFIQIYVRVSEKGPEKGPDTTGWAQPIGYLGQQKLRNLQVCVDVFAFFIAGLMLLSGHPPKHPLE